MPTQGGLRRVLQPGGQEYLLVFPIMHPSKSLMRARLTIDAFKLTILSPWCSRKMLKPRVVHYFLKTKRCTIKFQNHRKTPQNLSTPPKNTTARTQHKIGGPVHAAELVCRFKIKSPKSASHCGHQPASRSSLLHFHKSWITRGKCMIC